MGSLNSSSVKKKEEGNFQQLNKNLGIIKNSIFSLNKNIISEHQKTNLAIKGLEAEQKKASMVQKKTNMEIKGLRSDIEKTNKILSELIIIMKEDKNKTNQNNDDIKINSSFHNNNIVEPKENKRYKNIFN